MARTTSAPMSAMPPRVPPTMAPIGVGLGNDVGVGVGLVLVLVLVLIVVREVNIVCDSEDEDVNVGLVEERIELVVGRFMFIVTFT